MERLNIGSRACLDKGELSVYTTNRTGRLGLIRLAVSALLGRLRQEKDFLAFTTKDIWIGTKHKRVRVALDGEVTIIPSICRKVMANSTWQDARAWLWKRSQDAEWICFLQATTT